MDQEPMDEQGTQLFNAMVRWRALSTTTILIAFASGFSQLVVSTTGGGASLSRGLAGIAVLMILGAVATTFVAYFARRRFLRWYSSNG